LISSSASGITNKGSARKPITAVGKKTSGPFKIGKTMLRTITSVPKKESVKERTNIIFEDFLHPRNNIEASSHIFSL